MTLLTVAVVVLTGLFLVNLSLQLAVLRRMREHEEIHAKMPAGRLEGRDRMARRARRQPRTQLRLPYLRPGAGRLIGALVAIARGGHFDRL